MKIAHLSTHDVSGGAARAATRLHKALRHHEVDSRMFVADKSGDDSHTTSLHTSLGYSLRRNINRLPLTLVDLNAVVMPNVAWLPNPKLKTVENLLPDVVHLHWAQNGFVPLSWLRKLETPLVWTFHDMWPFCGVLHNEYETAQRFHEPYTKNNRPPGRSGFDIDAAVWRHKRRIYDSLPSVAAVAPSRWLADKAKKSFLWSNRRIEVIPNGLDTSVFKPADQSAARRLFNLPQEKTILLFGAMYARDDVNKGYDKLLAALHQLDLPPHSVHLAVFGMDQPDQPDPLPFPVSYHGVLKDETSMAALYSAADVMIVPSLQESFGLTAAEPIACGRPVVAFNTSGLRDVIDHETNGYLAEPYDPADLANGIRWIFGSPGRWQSLCDAAREKALRTFSADVVAKRHLALYEELLDRPKPASPVPPARAPLAEPVAP